MRRNLLLGGLCVLALAGVAPGAVVIFDDFEAGEGRFTSAPNASGTSTGFVVAGTTLTHSTGTGIDGGNSQRLIVDDDPAVNVPATPTHNWRIRNLSGGGTIANNVSFASTGYVGFWLKTSTPNLQASIVIDDTSTITERGKYVNVIGDGQWHAYEWNLDAATASTEWFNFNAGNGLIDSANVTIDAVYILSPFVSGSDTDAEVFIDNVSHNPDASITIVPEPTSLMMLAGVAGIALMARRRGR